MPSHQILVDDRQAHIAGSAFDLAHGAFDIDRIHIFHLDLGDLADLRAGYLANFFAVGNAEPFSTPAAFSSRTAAGGDLRMKVKDPSVKMVISAGMTSPARFDVRALYSLQNAIILMPCPARAGPTGVQDWLYRPSSANEQLL